MHAIAAKMSLTYRHQRQVRYSVSSPPSSRPTAPSAPAMAPKTPKALPRSLVPPNVVLSSDNAAGASSAPKAPWQACTEQQHAAEGEGVGHDHTLALDVALSSIDLSWDAIKQPQALRPQ
jgi:hypothetical protein